MIRYEDIAEKVQKHHPKADLTLLQKAYVFTAREHANQYRKSGEPYLSHPLEVASILADMRLDVIAVTVGLLHDVVEDTLTDIETIRKYFGDAVALITDGVTKLSRIQFTSVQHKQAENFRKLLLAMSDDVRVILVKLADRLHNMRTLQYLQPEQRQRIAKETQDIYVPIANRLGMGKIKGELEDLAFLYLEPEKYQEIIALVERKRAAGEKFLKEVEERLQQLVTEQNIPVEFQSRIKRVSSIHSKMRRQRISADEVYDFFALRAVTDTVQNCYGILGILHTHWRLVPGRFKDFIGMPRPNGYQSVHTTVFSESGIPFEVQIRTREMHRVAEEGIAAHWRYKEGVFTQDAGDQRFTWLRHLLEWQEEVEDPHDFMNTLKIDLYPEEVYVFTPKGDVITLPRGSTPLDFAYGIHTEVGNHCAQSRVKGRIVPLRYELHNGDIVEIVTAKDRRPSRDWLGMVKTAKARNKIRQWLTKHEKQESIELGRKILEKEGFKFKTSMKSILNNAGLPAKLEELGLNKMDDLLSGIGFGKISARHFLEHLLGVKADGSDVKDSGSTLKRLVKGVFRLSSDKFLVGGMNDILISRARCCSPLPGEEIIGYISRGRGIIVHSMNCANIDRVLNHPDKRIEVTWGKRQKGESYPVTLQIFTDDRKGLIADISNKISQSDINIREFRTQTDNRQRGLFQVSMDVQDLEHLEKIVRIIKGIKDVKEVERLPRARMDSDRKL